MRRSLTAGLAVLGLTAAAGLAVLLFAGQSAPSRPPGDRPVVGLDTSLPIYWPESGSVADALQQVDELPWPRRAIERHYRLQPLDLLAAPDGASRISGLRYLLIAQPRPFTPAENVALDDWVRGGGRLLLFVDPLLTAQSRFALGDPRRPQDVALLSPILARWGLELAFDEVQPAGERLVELLGIHVPLNLPGQLRHVSTAPDAPANCLLLGTGVAASCAIGAGRVLVVADAALLDPQGGFPEARAEALQRLMAAAFRAD